MLQGTRILLCLVLLASTGFAQHRKSTKGGLYNFPYKGDTWTGEIINLDSETREVTLQYTDKKGKTEIFKARVKAGVRLAFKDRPEEKVTSVNLGDRITAYYIAPGQKYFVQDERGKKKEVVADENLIFEIEVWTAKKQKD